MLHSGQHPFAQSEPPSRRRGNQITDVRCLTRRAGVRRIRSKQRWILPKSGGVTEKTHVTVLHEPVHRLDEKHWKSACGRPRQAQRRRCVVVRRVYPEVPTVVRTNLGSHFPFWARQSCRSNVLNNNITNAVLYTVTVMFKVTPRASILRFSTVTPRKPF